MPDASIPKGTPQLSSELSPRVDSVRARTSAEDISSVQAARDIHRKPSTNKRKANMNEEADPSSAGGRAREGASDAREEETISRERKANAPDPVHMANGRPILTGWPLIEEWMTTLDKGMVSDFNDDINTLLTFAGLFSAVLAGFLVQLYVGLQPSNNQDTNNLLAQNTLELRQISRQLANSSYVPIDIPLPSPSFQAGASVVWINTLWFLSLILSLASALFGMISKQWLREYLQWTTMSGLSENQVGLRQGRYEAFNEWKTPVIIASMPVLLELALILFLLGIEVLLWTLNGAVFGVCTVAVVTLIMLVIMVTVLPLFHERCAYKSPMGWAFVYAMSAVFSLYNRCVDLYKMLRDWLGSNDFETWKYHRFLRVDKDWRTWDLSRQWWSPNNRYLVGGQELGLHRLQTRALLWIAETSQDPRLLRAVEESIACRIMPELLSPFDRLVLDVYITCDYLCLDLSRLVPPSAEYASVDDYAGGHVADIKAVGLQVAASEFRVKQPGNEQWQDHKLDIDAPRSVYAWIAQMLACDLLAVVDQYSEDDVNRFGKQADYFLQGSMVLCGLFAYSAFMHDVRTSSAAALNRLAALFRRLSRDYDTLPLALRPLLPPLVTSLDECELVLSKPLLSIDDLPGQRTRLALTVSLGQPSTWSKADCSLFARLAQFALWEWKTERALSDTNALLPPLLDRMAACVLRCLDQRWEDCAMGQSLFNWASHLRELFDPDPSHSNRFSGQHLPSDLFPHGLVNALAQYCTAGLVTLSFVLERTRALISCSTSLHGQHTASGEKGGNTPHPESQHHNTLSMQARPQNGSLSPSSSQSLVSPSQAADDPPNNVLRARPPSPDESTSSQPVDIVDTVVVKEERKNVPSDNKRRPY